MLIPKQPKFDFSEAPWDRIKFVLPFLRGDVDYETGETRYNHLMENKPSALASWLNIASSLAQVRFSDGSRPLDYLKEIKWDPSLSKDRIYLYCDIKLIDLVRKAAKQHKFVEQPGVSIFHPGATSGWKEISFSEANLQLAFHENDRKIINGASCIVIEPDIDYYKDLISHTLLEVVPNTFTGGATHPELVYVLRWTVGRRESRDFNPPYTIV